MHLVQLAAFPGGAPPWLLPPSLGGLQAPQGHIAYPLLPTQRPQGFCCTFLLAGYYCWGGQPAPKQFVCLPSVPTLDSLCIGQTLRGYKASVDICGIWLWWPGEALEHGGGRVADVVHEDDTKALGAQEHAHAVIVVLVLGCDGGGNTGIGSMEQGAAGRGQGE